MIGFIVYLKNIIYWIIEYKLKTKGYYKQKLYEDIDIDTWKYILFENDKYANMV